MHLCLGEFRLNHAASFAHAGTAVGADGREVGAGVGSGVGSGIGNHVGRAVGTPVGGAVVGRTVGAAVGATGRKVGRCAGAAVGVDVPSSEPPPQAQHISFDVKSWSSYPPHQLGWVSYSSQPSPCGSAEWPSKSSQSPSLSPPHSHAPQSQLYVPSSVEHGYL